MDTRRALLVDAFAAELCDQRLAAGESRHTPYRMREPP